MQDRLPEPERMTVDEFLAFAKSRPDGERWELVEGVACMNASPTDWHQTVCLNIGSELRALKVKSGASWTPILDISTRVPVSPCSLPRPDVIVKERPTTGKAVSDDALVLFEVLSRSNSASNRAWRKRVYTSIPNCQHYVTVSMQRAEVIRHDRETEWKAIKLAGLDQVLDLPTINASLRLRDIYLWTPIK